MSNDNDNNNNDSEVITLSAFRPKPKDDTEEVHKEHVRNMLEQASEIDFISGVFIGVTESGPMVFDSTGNPMHTSYMTDIAKNVLTKQGQ